jgi:hypothetical protein
MTKKELFFELAKPNNSGYSRKVYTEEFTGKYSSLKLGNGGGWCRSDAGFGLKYNIVRHKVGNKIVAIELAGTKHA